jgi:O-antigen/teichoic acid export membrane protein
MSSTSRRIAYNAVVSSASKIIGTVLALVSIGFITRYLGKDGFGDYSIVLAFFAFFSAVADLGLYSISTREISRPGSDEEKIIGNVFAIRLLISLGIVIISPIIVMFFPYSQSVKTGILIAALAYFFASSYSVLIGLFQKRLVMDKVAIGELIGKVFQVAVVVAVVKLDLGFRLIIGSLLANMLVSFAVIYLWSRKYIVFKPLFNWPAWKDFLKESYPMGISAIVVFAYFKLDTILLSVMKTSADVGVYNVAYKVLESIVFFPAMFIGLVMPIMARYIFHERSKFELVADKTFKVFFIFAVPLLVGLSFLSRDVIKLIGGAGFSESAGVLRILAWALVFVFFGNYFTNILIAGNMQKKLMKILFFCAIFNISVNFVLIPKYSFMGAAVTSSLTELLVVILSGYLAYHELNYRPSLEKIWAILTSGALMASILYFFQGANLFILAAASALIYFLSLWIFKAISAEELLSLISKKGEEVREYEPVI